jgi:predicted amino acid dehydrogenase
MVRFIHNYVTDALATIVYKPKTPINAGYAFIVHPRDSADVFSNLPFLRFIPERILLDYLYLLHPFTVSTIHGLRTISDRSELTGWVIGLPMFANQMLENRALAKKKINQAIRLAKARGAKVIGLGGLTGSIMDGGAGLSENDGTVITAGRAYTTFVVTSYVEDAVKRFGLDKKDLVIAVVGAAGGVGRAIAKFLTKDLYRRILLIDLERKLERILTGLRGTGHRATDIVVTHEIGRVREADLIVTVTNAPEAVIGSEHIKSGAIIIDDAQPSDISHEVIRTRDDVIVIEAGVITCQRGIDVGANMRLANRDEIYCCLGEVMAIASNESHLEYQPDDITQEVVCEIAEMARKLGFRLAPYQAFAKVVGSEQMDRVRAILRERFGLSNQ